MERWRSDEMWIMGKGLEMENSLSLSGPEILDMEIFHRNREKKKKKEAHSLA